MKGKVGGTFQSTIHIIMKHEELKASIIVLTYKQFDNIEVNIRSILKQTYKNYEVIISDDGSPNFDRAFIESIFKDDINASKFAIVTRTSNIGTVKNYNAAIKKASGDIVIPLSQDDEFFDEHVLSKIMKFFSDSKANICLGLRKNVLTNSVTPNSTQIALMKNAETKKLWFRNACANMFWGAALYFRKDYLLKNNLFDETFILVEDYSSVMSIIEKGEKIHIMEEPTIFYGMEGISKSDGREKHINPSYLNDSIRICTDNYTNARTMLNSNVCKWYLKYRIKWWKGQRLDNYIKVYSNIIIDLIIVIAKFLSAATGESIIDCRFAILWKFELLATKAKTILH